MTVCATLHITVRGGNGGQNVKKTCPVYSIKPFITKGTNHFEKNLSPPYLLGFRLHGRLSPNWCLLDTENELDDGVGQTHVVGASRGDDPIFFNVQWIFALRYGKI